MHRGLDRNELHRKGKIFCTDVFPKLCPGTVFRFAINELQGKILQLLKTESGCPARRRHRADRRPRRGRDALHRHRRPPRLPRHGQAKEEVGGQVQARDPGADLPEAPAGQHHQAAPGGEADLMRSLDLFRPLLSTLKLCKI